MNYFSISIQGTIATLALNRVGADSNVVNETFIDELVEVLDTLDEVEGLKGVILISEKDNFLDVWEVPALYEIQVADQWERAGRKAMECLDRIERDEKVFVAAIHGAVKGAGLSIALACDYRLATDAPQTFFQFPELKYGLIPHLGASQRTHQLCGLRTALELLLHAEKKNAKEAKTLGLVDRVVHPYGLQRIAEKQVQEMIGKQIVRVDRKSRTDKILDGNRLARSYIFNQSKDELREKMPYHYPAPLKVINCLEMGMKYDRDAGMETEVKHFDELVVHPVSKQLLRFYLKMKEPIAPLDASCLPIKRIGIMGASRAGGSLATACIQKKMTVILKEIHEDKAQVAQQQIWNYLKSPFDQPHKWSRLERERLMNHIRVQKHDRYLEQMDILVETVGEELDLKRHLLAKMEHVGRKQCIHLMHTYVTPVHLIAQNAERPEQVLGIHERFLEGRWQLTELIVPEKADPQAVAKVRFWLEQIGKRVIEVSDKTGFYLPRILAAYLHEALLLLEEGIKIPEIEEAALVLGFETGPFALMDLIGLSVVRDVMGMSLMALFTNNQGEGANWAAIFEQLLEKKVRGRGFGLGFYKYKEKGEQWIRKEVNEGVYAFFNKSRATANYPKKEIRLRLMAAMTQEAIKCLEEGVIRSKDDGDIGAILGWGYPAYTGGPFQYVDSVGQAKFIHKLEALAEKYGQRFMPAALLYGMAKDHAKFY